jgi:hypothetical protein
MSSGIQAGLLSSLLLTSAASFWTTEAVAQTSLTEFVRSDGRTENYYAAGDPYLVHGLASAQAFFPDVAVNTPDWSRGGLDEYVPIQLKRWRNRAAQAVMAVFRDEFFAHQHPDTGLVPFFRGGNDRASGYPRGNTSNLRFAYYASRLLEWFPDDVDTRDRAHALADGMIGYFSPPTGAGLLNVINVESGDAPRPAPGEPPVDSIRAFGLDYGMLIQGMGGLARQLGTQYHWTWAAPRVGFVWSERGSTHPVLADSYYTNGPDIVDPHASTDTHYLMRWAYEGARAAGDDLTVLPLRDAASHWYSEGWFGNWEQCARYFRRDTGLPDGNAIFGDGKWNCQYLYSVLYRMTAQPAVISRMLAHWQQLRDESIGGTGLLPEQMREGEGVVDEGASGNQPVMLDALVDAYEATGRVDLLNHARALADAILLHSTEPVRDNTARPFLRLAETSLGSIGRLEVTFPAASGGVVVKRSDGPGTVVFDAVLPNQVAVIYLPAARYRVELRVGSSVRSVTLNVTAEGSIVEYQPGSPASNLLRGHVLNDADDDGVPDLGELGYSNSSGYIDLNNNGALNSGEPSVQVLPDGSFALLTSPGPRVLRAKAPTTSGWRWSASSPHPSGSTPGHSIQFHDPGLAVSSPAFCLTTRKRISGKVFHDVNGSGVQGATEPNLTETLVYLDRNLNSVRDFGEPFAASQVDGKFSIGNLSSGGTLRIVRRIGLPQTSAPPTGAYSVTLNGAAGQHVTGANFGVH